MSEPYVGEIRMFAGGFAPRGYSLCDGQLLGVSQHDALFSLYGTIYGGDGRTTFGLPDLRGRLPIHAGSGPGLSERRLGSKSGQENVTLTTNQMPTHTHDMQASTSLANETAPADNVLGQSTTAQMYLATNPTVPLAGASIQNTGGSQSHTNEMPFLCINLICALVGVYPSRN